MEVGEYQLKVTESIKNVKYADIMISEEIIYWGIISKGITFELHLLLSIYPLSLSLFVSLYLFACVFFYLFFVCESLSLSNLTYNAPYVKCLHHQVIEWSEDSLIRPCEPKVWGTWGRGQRSFICHHDNFFNTIILIMTMIIITLFVITTMGAV